MSFLTWHREVVDPVVPILGSVQGQVGWGFGQSSLAEGVPSGQERVVSCCGLRPYPELLLLAGGEQHPTTLFRGFLEVGTCLQERLKLQYLTF